MNWITKHSLLESDPNILVTYRSSLSLLPFPREQLSSHGTLNTHVCTLRFGRYRQKSRTIVTCPGRLGGWLLEEWGFLPGVGTELVRTSCRGRLLQRLFPEVSSQSVQLKVGQLLFKLRSSFLQQNFLPLHADCHLGTSPMH